MQRQVFRHLYVTQNPKKGYTCRDRSSDLCASATWGIHAGIGLQTSVRQLHGVYTQGQVFRPLCVSYRGIHEEIGLQTSVCQLHGVYTQGQVFRPLCVSQNHEKGYTRRDKSYRPLWASYRDIHEEIGLQTSVRQLHGVYMQGLVFRPLCVSYMGYTRRNRSLDLCASATWGIHEEIGLYTSVGQLRGYTGRDRSLDL